MPELKLVHKGSTKDVYQSGENYLFRFSDRYSVFDWGEMPDHLNEKGKGLAQFTKNIYARFEKQGIRHHLINAACGENEIIVCPFEVIRGKLASMPDKENIFVPLEVIFRLGVAKGSSLLKRFKSESDWKAAGFDRAYQELEFFNEPKVEFTTKLERFDRPLTHAEAKALAGLNETEWANLVLTTKNIALEMKNVFQEYGISVWDGKVEFAVGERKNGAREIILVDSIGPDELRLTKEGVLLSKEVIRQYYRSSEWYKKLDEVKAKHGEKFKDFISPPEPLSKEFKNAVEELYQVLPALISGDETASFRLQKLLPRLKGHWS
jgi:phosphoribosylaminoimidazole-succinocarboxamide synthase